MKVIKWIFKMNFFDINNLRLFICIFDFVVFRVFRMFLNLLLFRYVFLSENVLMLFFLVK